MEFYIVWIIGSVLLVLFIIMLYKYWPKGNIIHEGLYILPYNYKTKTKVSRKIPYTRYVFGKHRRQYLLYYAPPVDVLDQKKIIVFYHGGAWTFGSPEMFRITATVLATMGYHVFMPSHRRVPFFRYEHMREDLDLAYLKIRSILSEKGLSNYKIILGGMSSGGNLSALLAYDRASLQRLNRGQSDFSGLMIFCGVLDTRWLPFSLVRWIYAGRKNSTRFQKASPIEYLEAKESLPILIVHGDKDGIVPYEMAVHFKEVLAERQAENITFYTLKDGTHLEVGDWNFEDNSLRKCIEKWLLAI